ncbi:uncharacterized protein LOC141906152 isoform X2 [Tubulanus polymorphus]|uniref:uncharacterized protein LOC141906152 isoform X2 n=1 Tax=Tubulanus polymorphus TaxID=672921 RepID=UPI003DA248D3
MESYIEEDNKKSEIQECIDLSAGNIVSTEPIMNEPQRIIDTPTSFTASMPLLQGMLEGGKVALTRTPVLSESLVGKCVVEEKVESHSNSPTAVVPLSFADQGLGHVIEHSYSDSSLLKSTVQSHAGNDIVAFKPTDPGVVSDSLSSELEEPVVSSIDKIIESVKAMGENAASPAESSPSDFNSVSMIANFDESSNVPSSFDPIDESSNLGECKNDDELSNNDLSVAVSAADLMDDTSNLPSETGSMMDTSDSIHFTVPKNINEETMMSVDDTTKDDSMDGSTKETNKPKRRPKSRRSSTCSMAVELGLDSHKIGHNLPVEKIFEYQWPQEKNGEWFLLQEQLSEYLGIKSFKRKYPDMTRHNVDMRERNFLKETGAVTETQCDLGLTAIRTEDVLDMMAKEYPEKYTELTAILHEKEKKRADETKKKYQQPTIEKSKMKEFIRKAVKRCAEYNQSFMREKREERAAYFDLQTMEIHHPITKKMKLEPRALGAYPVALLPGQYQDSYKMYKSEELKYFPLNTVMYNPPKKLKTIYADPNEPTDSESEDSVASDSSEETNSKGTDGQNVSNGGDDQSTPKPSNSPECRICNETADSNNQEQFIVCSECKSAGHPSCLDVTADMIPIITSYPWQCMECKTCVECMDPHDEDKMMFCDRCDRGYHTFCVGLRSIPNGNWKCPSCKPPTEKTPGKPGRKPKNSKDLKAEPQEVKVRKKPGPKPKNKDNKEPKEKREPKKKKEVKEKVPKIKKEKTPKKQEKEEDENE